MPYMQSVEYENPKYRNTQNEVTRANHELISAQANLNSFTCRIEQLESLRDRLRAIANYAEHLGELHPSDFSALESNEIALLTRTLGAPTAARDACRHVSRRVDIYTESVQINTAELARWKEVQETLSENGRYIKLNKSDIVEALRDIAGVKPGSIALGQNAEGTPFIRWIFTGLIMRPDHNKYEWINGERPRVALRDCVVKIETIDNAITISPAYGEEALCVYKYANVTTPHPHILDSYHPCFGDFGGPITEACAEHDWTTAASVIKMFLEQAYSADSAGKNWVRGIAPSDTYAIGETSCKSRSTDEYVRFTEDAEAPGHWVEHAVQVESPEYVGRPEYVERPEAVEAYGAMSDAERRAFLQRVHAISPLA